MATAIQAKAFVQVAKVGDVPGGTMKEIKVRGRTMLLARVGDKYYAADNVCPHMGANLALGTLEGTVLTCPRHHSKFDLADGRVIRWTDWTGIKASVSKLFRPPRPPTMFPVKVEGDSILVEI